MSGPGGVGKGSLVEELVAADPALWLSRSWTTRAPRLGEHEGAYHFVDRATFEEAIAADRFLEWAEFLGQLYGTPVPGAPPGRDVVLEIDVQGAAQVMDSCPDAMTIWLVAPSADVQSARLRARGDSEEGVSRRVELGRQEDRVGRRLAAHVVVNDDLSRAVSEVRGIIEERRGNARRPPQGA
ncbi:MAG: guanylate kinase [Acidimicrobiales bacterium]